MTADRDADPGQSIPRTLNTTAPVEALVLSHPHQDHCGLLRALPAGWPVWCGAASELLIRLTASISGGGLQQAFHNYRSQTAFTAGPFSITPYLTDHCWSTAPGSACSWDQHLDGFANVRRLRDGEPFVIG